MKNRYASLVGVRKLAFREEEIAPGPREVLIRVIACGICRGDLRVLAEGKPVERFGHEPVGEVIEKGPDVERVDIGDWVVGTLRGSFATHITADENEVYRVSPQLGFFACLAEPIKCVTTVVRAAAPSFGDAVAVVGCGFMGLCAVSALGDDRGLASLIAVDPIESRRQLALEFGATHAIEPQGTDAKADVLKLTDGAGVDVAIEFAGSTGAVNFAASLLKTRGRLALGGGSGLSDSVYGKAATVVHVPPAFSPDQSDDYRRAISAMARGVFPLAKLVTHRIPFGQIQQGLEQIADGDHAYLKGIVLTDEDGAPASADRR